MGAGFQALSDGRQEIAGLGFFHPVEYFIH